MNYRESLAHILRCQNDCITLQKAGFATQAKIAVDLVLQGLSVVVVARNRDEQAAIRSLVALYSQEPINTASHHIFSSQWILVHGVTHRAMTKTSWVESLATLYTLQFGKAKGIIVTADSLIHKLVPKTFFDNQTAHITLGEETSPDMILEQAVIWGYERVSMVSKPGEISKRGDIVDIMPPGYNSPVRLDFFGDILEEIRFFDPSTQRSKEGVDEVTILPVSPINYHNVPMIKAYWKSLFQEKKISENELYSLNCLLEQQNPMLLPGNCYSEPSVLEEWIPKEYAWVMHDRYEVEETVTRLGEKWFDIVQNQKNTYVQPVSLAFRTLDTLQGIWEQSTIVQTEKLVSGTNTTSITTKERTISTFQELFPSKEEQNRPWQTLIHALTEWKTTKFQVILCFSSIRSRDKFLTIAAQDGISPLLHYNPNDKGIFAIINPYREGIDLSWCETVILGEDILQPHSKKVQRSASEAFKGLNRYDELTPGDFLVHKDYGIGKFNGLSRMAVGETANDYLVLEYSGDDKLYLPVDRLSLVQKFKTTGDIVPALDKLGSSLWRASTEKAKKAIEKVAEDLIEMYALRKVTKGFRYNPIGEIYREFEASFGFEETPDQARAIQDVLCDMEKDEPMDRLVCGDVGFGKTEVALRAAFRAASEGRQVVLLCPTTILSEQHYHTFRSRLSAFAINVGLLNRFVPAAKQKEVLKLAENGQLDVLVGTHKLLSDKVILPNLGLFILDEEQRFGVRHKEKLKQIKKNIDVLTLTATPIPRTLQLSMSGVRDLSIIETPPPERKPVSTLVIKKDEEKIKELLEAEISRSGQVFWVYNRIQGLENIVSFVKKLVPTARVGIAHGQMHEKQLEENMHAFWHGDLDVLVSTSIVESGLDFPRANTLIVDQAHMFGLGQLYQLRGRVGRSDRQAYAVFIVPDPEHLTEIAHERLKILSDLDYLGAGFQVAMEDLRIRGAGNILGEVQSGHMSRIGLELYLEMLEEAVKKIKGTPNVTCHETEITLSITAHIPDSYISDSHDRLCWYKTLSSAQSADIRREIELELRDRYGQIPKELKVFIAILDLKQMLTALRAIKAEIYKDKVKILWSNTYSAFSVEQVMSLVSMNPDTIKILPPSGLEIKLDKAIPEEERFGEVQKKLESLCHV